VKKSRSRWLALKRASQADREQQSGGLVEGQTARGRKNLEEAEQSQHGEAAARSANTTNARPPQDDSHSDDRLHSREQPESPAPRERPRAEHSEPPSASDHRQLVAAAATACDEASAERVPRSRP